MNTISVEPSTGPDVQVPLAFAVVTYGINVEQVECNMQCHLSLDIEEDGYANIVVATTRVEQFTNLPWNLTTSPGG